MEDFGLEEVTVAGPDGKPRRLFGMAPEKVFAWALRVLTVVMVGWASFMLGGLRTDIQALTSQLTALKVEFSAATTVLQAQGQSIVRLDTRIGSAEIRLDGHDRRIERLEDRR